MQFSDVLTVFADLGNFLGVRVKEINILTEKVFTTGGVGREDAAAAILGGGGPAA